MKTCVALLFAATLAGCAGPRLSDSREVTIGNAVYIVSSAGPGTYFVAYRDYLANNLYVWPAEHLTRKAAFITAIETATKCKVVDSVLDSAAANLSATVKC